MVALVRNFLFDRMTSFSEKTVARFRSLQDIFNKAFENCQAAIFKKAIPISITALLKILPSSLRVYRKMQLNQLKESFIKSLESRHIDTSRFDEFFEVRKENEIYLF